MPSLFWTVALLVDTGVFAECAQAEKAPCPQACEVAENVPETPEDGWFKFTLEGHYSPGAFGPQVGLPSQALVHEFLPPSHPFPHRGGFPSHGFPAPYPHGPENFPQPLTAFAPARGFPFACPVPPCPAEVNHVFPHPGLSHPALGHAFAPQHSPRFVGRFLENAGQGLPPVYPVGTCNVFEPTGCSPFEVAGPCPYAAPYPDLQYRQVTLKTGTQKTGTECVCKAECCQSGKCCKEGCCQDGEKCDACPCPAEKAASGETVVLAFEADWCGPCQQMKPVVQSLRREGYRVQPVNVDAEQGTAAKFGVRSLPCYVAVKNGREVGRVVGLTTPEKLRAFAACCKTSACQANVCATQNTCPTTTVSVSATQCEFPGAVKVERFVRVTYPVQSSAATAMQTLLQGQCPDVQDCQVEGDTLVVTAPEHAQLVIAQFLATVVKPGAQRAATANRPVARTVAPVRYQVAPKLEYRTLTPAGFVTPSVCPQTCPTGKAKAPGDAGCQIDAAQGNVRIVVHTQDGQTSQVRLLCDEDGVTVEKQSGDEPPCRLRAKQVQMKLCPSAFDFADGIPTARDVFQFYLGLTR